MAPGHVTQLLGRLRGGDGEALDELLPALYDDLRDLARYHLSDERSGHTLGPTALVHEAYVRLARQQRLNPLSRAQFFAIAGRTMRRILLDHARARKRLKRGGGVEPVSFEDAAAWLSENEAEELIVLDAALVRLARVDPRGATVVEMRFFGGFTVEETARHLEVSTKTIQRDWIAARAWLRKEVHEELGLTAVLESSEEWGEPT